MANSSVSWNGVAPEIDKELLPQDVQEFNYPENFAQEFNQNPIDVFKKVLRGNLSLTEANYSGQYFFFCKGISAKSLTQFIFNPTFPLTPHSFLFYYFTSITLDYVDLLDAMRYCLPRIAFTMKRDVNEEIFESFADAYMTHNMYLPYTTEDIVKITKACVLNSAYVVNHSSLIDKGRFKALFKGTSLREETAGYLFDEICANPIPLFFTFCHFETPPDYKKSGMLKKKGGYFKSMKNRFFVIQDSLLKYYNDKSMKEQIGEIEICGTISSFVEKQKKDEAHILMKNIYGGTIGYKVNKKDNVRKASNHSDYCAYSDDKDEILAWASTLNLLSFCKTIESSLETVSK